jgi:hypothetical protein
MIENPIKLDVSGSLYKPPLGDKLGGLVSYPKSLRQQFNAVLQQVFEGESRGTPLESINSPDSRLFLSLNSSSNTLREG